MKQKLFQVMVAVLVCGSARAQVNSGSNGSDGAFNPTTNTVINMADHSDGIYHYTSVNIPTNVTVTFIPNTNNTPVVWLVQSDCTILGVVSLNGRVCSNNIGAAGGPAGFRGGNAVASREAGLGPGGGRVDDPGKFGGNASFGTLGQTGQIGQQNLPGETYGNSFLVPLIGGSGGGGPGGGGGGAVLIAASGSITVAGRIDSNGGNGYSSLGFDTVSGGGGGAVEALYGLSPLLSPEEVAYSQGVGMDLVATAGAISLRLLGTDVLGLTRLTIPSTALQETRSHREVISQS